MEDNDTYGQALKNVSRRDVDKKKAQEFTKGFNEPQTLSEGWQNLKKAFGKDQASNDQ